MVDDRPLEGVAVIGRVRPVRTRLSVSLPTGLRHHPPMSSSGRMWREVTGGLEAAGVTVDYADPGRRRIRRKADVWLTSGHEGALNVDRPVVAHLHEAPWAEPPELHDLDPDFARLYREQSQRGVDAAAAVITPSEASRRQVIEAHGADPGAVHVVPHGVDTKTFNPSRAPEGRAFLRANGCDRPYIVAVSTVHPRKNLPLLRQAVVTLARRGHPHALVLVLSPAPDRADSRALDEEARADLPGYPGRIHCFDRLSDETLASVIAAADVLCTPSRSEGFGFAPLEAMACGTPTVVSDRGSLPEVVGPAGLVVAPEPAAVADALESIIDSPGTSRRMAELGLVRSADFSWPAIVGRWLSVLEQVARP